MSVVLLPLQIVVLPKMFIVGGAFTVTPMLAVFLQPLASVPVTVYVPETAGTKGTASVTPPLQE